MAKFEGGNLDHSGFNAIKETLIESLAGAIHAELVSLGEDAQGISWFSSNAEAYACAAVKRAA